jgi:outer membrane receptor protein involved in Fe transport
MSCCSIRFNRLNFLYFTLYSILILSLSTPLSALAEGPGSNAGETAKDPVSRVTVLAQAEQAGADEAEAIEEVVVVGTQIKGAAISEALAVSVVDAQEIEAMGVSSGDELFDSMPEMGQNFFNEAEAHSGGVNSVRGDMGAFNLRNMGTGNTLALLNGRRMVDSAGYQTEEVGGAFVPVSSANTNAIPVYGIDRVEVLRDGASAIYGADAVAGVINQVLKTDFEGLNVRARFDDYDNIPRNDQRVNIEWGRFFNNGRTNVGVFFDYYHRDRVNSQDDPRWADQNYSRFVPDEWAGAFGTNYSSNSAFPQIDFRSGAEGRRARDAGMADSAGEIQTFAAGDPRCTFTINDRVCGAPDTANPYNLNENRDVFSELDRYNLFLYVNHEMESGTESFTELSWYEADSNMKVHAALASAGASDLQLGPEYYYNPFGPCGSPNRVPEADAAGIDCNGERLELDFFRWLEAPRVSDTENHIYRFLQGFRGTSGSWDWETALVWSEAERYNVTHNRISNSIMQELLDSSSPDTYNIFSGADGDLEGLRPAIIDVYRKDKSDLKMIDFKLSRPDLFEMPAGPVGFLAGVEYREESFSDDRDPRLDGTIVYTAYEGATFPIVSDVANSSPTSDNSGSRDVTSLFTEFAIPVFATLDVQLALRYEDFSDVGSTTVGKFAFGWRPIDNVLVRGSWSEAFRAPNLITINEQLVVRSNTRDDFVCRYAAIQNGVDPGDMDGDCDWSTQRRARGSESLVPEESTNTSIGFVWDATDNLTFTLDYWTIEKENSIGLFGENNHTIYDLLLRIRAGTDNCDQTFNPAVGRDSDIDEDDLPLYLAAGVCPVGQLEYVEDTYTNLDTRTIEGHDIGIYYDKDTRAGDFSFKFVGTFYDKYTQLGSSGLALEVQNALDSGELPAWINLRGYGDLLQREGNMDEKYNASVRWRKGDWGAYLSMLKLGSFYDADTAITLDSGEILNWWLPSMTTYNASLDYNFDAFGADTRLRFGVNNLTDERAPICDCRFGYWSDAHRDTGRYWYLDWRLSFN